MKKFGIIILTALAAFLLLLASAAGLAWWWANSPVQLANEPVDYLVEPGSSPTRVANTMVAAGIKLNPKAFVAMARLSGLDRRLKAGAYEAVAGDSPWRLLNRMADGDMLQSRLTFVEGWTYARIRQALASDPNVKDTLDDVSDKELAERLGITTTSLEGWFYPDTYVFAKGTSDFDILRRAYQAQLQKLEAFWANRADNLPLKTPYDALILASIIEKETGHAPDRERVAGVFINRLRVGMPLQTDPSVIYGMGEAYQGRIRKRDLTTDTPWNTYTRNGLPPTPIASAGSAALQAALQPEEHAYYYFVSRGDGTSQFSRNLAEHNRAVAKYILGRN